MDYPKVKKSKKTKILIVILIIVLLATFFGAGLVIGKVTSGKITFRGDIELYKPTDLPDLFDSKLLGQVWTIIQSDYVDKENIDETKLFYSTIEGFVAGLGDQHSVFFDPETTDEFEAQIAGEFEGIGAEISIKDSILTVVAPLTGSPAEKAGLMAGDKIFAVDGKDIIGLSVDKAARLIRGPKGTQVTLSVIRGDEEPQEIIITRDVIEMHSVEWSFRDDGLLYLKLKAFNGDTMKLFDQLAKEVRSRNPKGIVLDLRNNPGGLLTTALDVSSLWIENDVLVVEKFGNGSEKKYNASRNAPFKNIPTVILINQGSASGSEILAGAFQDYELGKLVGKKSFGKGSVQALKKLPDGSSIKITTAKWLTPKHRSISDEGIVPDVEVEFTREDLDAERDPQLDKAIELLTK